MPDLTDAERNTLAWHTLPCERIWGGCGEAVGRRCVTSSGARTAPHKPRLVALDVWLSLRPEVDALVEKNEGLADELRERETEIVDLNAEIDRQTRAFDGLGVAHRAALTQIADLAATVGRRDDTIDQLQARIEELTPEQTTTFGAGGGNIDRTKDAIDIDRWYGGSGDVDKAVTKAKANHAAGILTWASFKLPFNWADMASGKGDAWAQNLLIKLAGLGFEVWVAFHHEPEGDGNTADWRRMQGRLATFCEQTQIAVGGDIKFWLVVTGWHQEFGTAAANKWDVLYPAGAPIYGIAYDAPYLAYGKPTDPTKPFDNGWTEGKVYVEKLAARAKAYGVKAAIGEFGYSDEAFAKDKAWLDRTLASAKAEGLLGVCYFDTTLNSAKSWTLGAPTSPKRAHFYAALDAVRG